MTAFMNMPDPATSSLTQGSFNSDKNAPRTVSAKSTGKLASMGDGFTAKGEFGSGVGSYPTKKSGNVDCCLPGANDDSLIKNFKK